MSQPFKHFVDRLFEIKPVRLSTHIRANDEDIERSCEQIKLLGQLYLSAVRGTLDKIAGNLPVGDSQMIDVLYAVHLKEVNASSADMIADIRALGDSP